MSFKYTIVEIIPDGETTIITKVEYDFDGDKVELLIPHYPPADKDDIIKKIEEFGRAEEPRVNASKAQSKLIEQLRKL